MNKQIERKPQLIIFDHDGVLIDSEIVWHQVNAAEMTRLGLPLTVEKSITLFSGISKDEFEKVMLQEFGKMLTPEDSMAINLKTENSYHEALKAVTEITQVLDYLEQKHIKKCIASNGDNEYVLTTLTITNLSTYFKPDQIFSSTMVKKGKPAPDVFLHAAQFFDVNPKDCLVIEDHPLGIKAAIAANMPVIGFLGGSQAKNPQVRERILKTEPTLTVNNAEELLTILKKLLG